VKRAVAFTLLAVAGFLLAGCGSDHAVSLGSPQEPTSASQETPTTTGQVTAPLSFDVWFARGEQLVSERRTHARTPRVATAAVSALLAGPTSAERAAGVKTAIPAGTRLLGVSINDGVATVDLTSQYQSGGGSLSMQVRLGQVVYTLTQFPTVKSVRFALDGAPVNVFSSEGIVLGHPVGRADYRDLALGTATPAAAELPGNWQSLSRAPVPIDAYLSAVWTGHEALLYGVTGVARDGNFLKASNGAEAYNPATRTWRRLPTPPGPRESVGNHPAVWTGTEMIVWPSKAFNPGTNRWRTLPHAPTMDASGLVVWTGREVIGWGGGCCGDAFDDGAAYNPATNTWRKLAPSPLAGSTAPVGAWTGHELVIFVGNLQPGGNPWPARLARAAAYDPATNRWRRIAPLPEPRGGARAVWDGHEVLVVGGAGEAQGAKPAPVATVGFAYDPATNRWRRLPPMESGRLGAAVVWTGHRLILWGGAQSAGARAPAIPPHGLSYDPAANRWSPLPQAPLLGRLGPAGVWTGRAMIVWGGNRPAVPLGTGTRYFHDGAGFAPRTP